MRAGGRFVGLMMMVTAGVLTAPSNPASGDASEAPAGNVPAAVITAGTGHTCAILDGGTVKCWGSNASGELGLGDTSVRGDGPAEMGSALSDVDLGTGRIATAITAGNAYSCALLDNGTVKCWGNGTSGRLGQGNTANRGDNANEMGDNLPAIALGTGRTATAITAGETHTCALLDNGAVKCWGNGGAGRLGQGNTNDLGDGPNEMGDNLPAIDFGTGRTATAITAGTSHTCALLDNGTVKCWGQGSNGVLGQGNTDSLGDVSGEMGNNLPAIDLGNGRTATSITAGSSHTCALLDDATTKCWGQGSNGQLGQGDLSPVGDGPGEMGDDLPPIALGTGRTATAITAGASHNCALLDNGTMKCWGSGVSGQLGHGNTSALGDLPGEMGDGLPVVSLDGLVGRSAIAVTLSASRSSVVAGATITYTVAVRNTGTIPLTGISVTTGDTACGRTILTIIPTTSTTYTCTYTTTGADVPQMSNQVFVTTAQGVSAQSARVRTRVDALVIRPDALVRVGTSGAFTGDGTYNSTGAGQTITRSVARGKKVSYTWRIQNDGNTARTFTLKGTKGNARFSVGYKRGSTAITSAVVAGTATTASVQPGKSVSVTVTVTPNATARSGNTVALALTARTGGVVDTVTTTTRRS